MTLNRILDTYSSAQNTILNSQPDIVDAGKIKKCKLSNWLLWLFKQKRKYYICQNYTDLIWNAEWFSWSSFLALNKKYHHKDRIQSYNFFYDLIF